MIPFRPSPSAPVTEPCTNCITIPATRRTVSIIWGTPLRRRPGGPGGGDVEQQHVKRYWRDHRLYTRTHPATLFPRVPAVYSHFLYFVNTSPLCVCPFFFCSRTRARERCDPTKYRERQTVPRSRQRRLRSPNCLCTPFLAEESMRFGSPRDVTLSGDWFLGKPREARGPVA